ncbi:Chromatin structure remodeling complex protein sfh1 [Coniochaeta pulveracea]|uniref:Chromatin structure remodeling complex protein sfh1 n=1 Tax=Coniochaeta pulveracea TaxID=177199 RepID=A0A420YLK2_9PEZI|nr:Chromatin structure remodeling complex protein sfh1 [Coniochaeta pulveracea]
MASRSQAQAMSSAYAPRLRTYNNTLLLPVLPSATPSNPLVRTTKRGTTALNYAEDGYDDFDEDEDEGRRRRPTGLRSLRQEDSTAKVDPSEKVGKETSEPVEMQGIYRDWITRPKTFRPDAQSYAQAVLPLTLIPIRVDLDIPAFTPQPAVQGPNPTGDPNNPLYKPGEVTLPYRLRDFFMWNLHETLITTDQFATTLVQDLDLPNKYNTIAEISKQIRTQLEEYAGVALHPLFHSQPQTSAPQDAKPSTPLPQISAISRADTPVANAPGTPSKLRHMSPAPTTVRTAAGEVTASATPIPLDSDDFSPDDTYRCIINLNINLSSMVYTDKFEWSLLHPPGTAEAFAKQTCADLGLYGEWVPAMTHAIYEAVLRLKKEACESGGLVSAWGLTSATGASEYPNEAAASAGGEGAGWRYDPEHLGDEWEPKLEFLSKEEIEKREGDRERQIRRLRRETARFSSNTGMSGGVPVGFGFGGLIEQDEERMGRGERSKKKRRFRSLSPLRSGTPGGRGTPDVGGYAAGGGGYGGGGSLTDQERAAWRCSHCRVWGTAVWAVRDGPYGPRSLCNNCGFMYERDKKLPSWMKNLHALDLRQG